MRPLIIVSFLLALSSGSFAQRMSTLRLPSPDAVVYDNNGNDLRGFITTHKSDFTAKSEMVKSAVGSDWAYVQARNVKVPGTDRKGNLNYSQPFDVTVAISNAGSAPKSTWWAREYNSAKGKLTWFTTDNSNNPGMEVVKYDVFINELNTKKMTLVEYNDTVVNEYDYDDMVKNCLFVKQGTIPEIAEYGEITKFTNHFLSKFSSTSDPVLEGKSFVTFQKAGSHDYVTYFNVVNSKLTGAIWQMDAPFEADRMRFVNALLHKLTGNTLYFYGDTFLGLDKIIRKKTDDTNLRVEFLKTKSSKIFNKDI